MPILHKVSPRKTLDAAIVRDPLVVSWETTVRDVLSRMSGTPSTCETSRAADPQAEIHLKARSSCVLVVRDARLVGILTERDIVRLGAQQHLSQQAIIQTVMTQPVIALRETDLTDVFSAIGLLQRHQIRHLPILDEQDHLTGLVTYESLRQASRPIDLLRLRLVREVMTAEVVCAGSGDSMLQVAQLMADHRISCVVIVDPPGADLNSSQAQPMPIGILTERDLVQFQALGLVLQDVAAAAVMSTPVFTITPEQSLWTVQQMMEQYFIRRVVVVGDRSELMGIVTQTSLLQALNPYEIYNLAEVLEQKVMRLEAEKVALLENRARVLEQQVSARTAALETQAERERLLAALALQIRSSLSLQAILDTTVKEVRRILGCDRVNIWQFDHNWHTVAVAESTDSPISLIGERINDTCFQQRQAELYRQGRIRVVSDIYATEMADCHRAMLIRFQIRSKVLLPLLCGDRLWGLINATESAYPRTWTDSEVDLLKALSVQLAIALQQATIHGQLQAELQERQQAEVRLLESQQSYASLATAAPVGIFRTDAQGSCIYVNDRWCQIAGLTAAESMGTGWQRALHPDDRLQILAEWASAVRDNRPFRREYRLQCPGGKITWVYSQAIAEADASGLTMGYVGTVTDISHRKQVELSLQRREAESRAVLSAIPDYMLRVGADGVYREVVTHRQQNDLVPSHIDPVGLAMAEVLPPDVATRHLHYIEQALTTGEIQLYEQQVCIGETLCDEEIRIVKSGEAEVLFMIRDISDRKQAERQLQELIEAAAAATTGENFFPKFVGYIAKALGVRHVRLTEQLGDKLRTLVAWAGGQPQPNFTYQAAQTPCGRTLQQGIYYCDQSVQMEFPEDLTLTELGVQSYLGLALTHTEGSALGTLCVLDPRPLQNPQRAENMLRVFAARAAAELERQRASDALEQLNMALEKRVQERTARLRERESQLQDFFDSANDLIQSVVLLTGRFEYVNRAWRETLDYAEGELSSMTIFDVLHPSCQAYYREVIAQMQAGQASSFERVELTFLTRNHQEILVEGSVNCRYDSQQTAVSARAIFRDITERKRTEEQLQLQADQERLLSNVTQQVRSSLKLGEILNATVKAVQQFLRADRVLVYRISESGTVAIAESVLAPWPSLLDKALPEAVFPEAVYQQFLKGQSYALGNCGPGAEAVLPGLADFLATIQVRAKIVVPITQQQTLRGLLIAHQCNGPRQWQPWEVNLLRQIADQLAIAIQQASLFEQLQQELSDRQQAQQQLTERNQQLAVTNDELARATRLKDEFLANMSHELRTPLNAILGMTEGLQEEVFGTINERQTKALKTVERSGAHLLELINDILDVAKIESGQVQLTLAPTAVAPLCRSSLAFIKQQALKKGINLTVQLPPHLPDLVVDERRMRQVLINLLTNAVKFTPEGGQVTLDVSCCPATTDKPHQYFLRFSVVDTGIGISPEHLDRLFQPFVQIDSALNRQYAGTGLGLSLVKRIVELHGGRVNVTSELNLGSCFTVDLPCSAARALQRGSEAPLASAPIQAQAEPTSPLILLAEDNEANIGTMSSYLQARGYRLQVARNGEEAISITQCEHPDLILMDIQMPGIDGLAAIREIRRTKVDVPIVALTALAMKGDSDRCLEAGANEYLSKPVKLKQLNIMIQKLLSQAA